MSQLAFPGLSLGEHESIPLDCIFSTRSSTADVRSPREKGIGVFQLSRDSQHPLLKAMLNRLGFPHILPSSSGRSAPQSEEESVLALLAVQGIILVIKIQNVFFSLKSKFLVEQHSRVACRDVKGYIFAHAGLPREEKKKKKRYHSKRMRKPLGECGGEETHQVWYLSY